MNVNYSAEGGRRWWSLLKETNADFQEESESVTSCRPVHLPWPPHCVDWGSVTTTCRWQIFIINNYFRRFDHKSKSFWSNCWKLGNANTWKQTSNQPSHVHMYVYVDGTPGQWAVKSMNTKDATQVIKKWWMRQKATKTESDACVK